MRGADDRGQSAVLSTVLLTVLVILLAAAVSWAFFGMDVPGLGGTSAAATPVVSLAVEADTTGLSVTHDAGPSLSTSDLVLVARSESGDERVQFETLAETSGDGDGRFEAGETYSQSSSLRGYADVRIVHEPTNTVLFRGTTVLAGGGSGLPTLNFDTATVSGYASQDGSGTAVTSGSTLSMEGNTWKRVEYPYTVTSDTILVFEFRSTEEGEIHAVGFDDDDSLSGDRFFQVLGTQSDGGPWQPVRDFETYSVGDGWVRYEVPVGQYYTGDMTVLVFATDDDAGQVPAPTADFRNVQVYEDAS